jgi:hypothetical protein
MRFSFQLMCVLALVAMGCSETTGTGGTAGDGGSGGTAGVGGAGGAGGVDPSPYASKDLWLCRPDIENDHCDAADLSTTEIQVDGRMVVLDEVAPNPDAEVDCFYVYPTMDSTPEPGNTETLFPHPESVIHAVEVQGARFRGLCRMFAPLYHQMTIGTYYKIPFVWQETEIFQKAYDDVVEAFEYYMRNHNEGRGFVLIGHSQGSHMLTKLLEDRFDNDEALRGQLVSAVLTGPTNRVQVLEAEFVGGSFTNIPLCTSADETGCVIAFDANAAGVETDYATSVLYYPPSARACVNPASFDGGPAATLAAFVYPHASPALGGLFPEEVDTEWVRYSNIYTSRCADANEHHVLLVDLSSDYTGEVPMTPQDIQETFAQQGSERNLHYVEPYLTYANLLRTVEQQIASWLN